MFLKHLKNKHSVEQSDSQPTLIVHWEEKSIEIKNLPAEVNADDLFFV